MGLCASSPPAAEDQEEQEPVLASAEVINNTSSVYDLNISQESVSKAFIKFLSEIKNWLHLIDFESLLVLFTKDSIKSLGQEAIDKFIFPVGTKLLIAQFLTRREEMSMNLNNRQMYEKENSKFLLRELVVQKDLNFFSFLIALIFPLFLSSDAYLALIEGSVGDLNITHNVESVNESGKAEAEETTMLEEDSVEYIFSELVKNEEVIELIETSSWRKKVDNFLEHFPLSLSISSANKQNNGYPLIFVNEMFTTLTGFRSADALGFDCSILHSYRTEEDQVRLISKALDEVKPIKVAFTNRKANGTDFFNMMSMHPVLSQTGIYTHVVGVHFDPVARGTNLSVLGKVDCLISVLKGILS